jgi:quercetin dioxygenase-like cupin family protein
MVVAFRFQSEGAEGKRHSHPHVQSTYVESGRFAFTVAGRELRGRTGRQLRHPVQRGAWLPLPEPGTLIDTFTPRRDDFLKPNP